MSIENKKDGKEPPKKNDFSWEDFDLEKFFKETNEVGKVIEKKDKKVKEGD
jgi:hypothetical protein